jgi:hypothetical protein
VITGKEAEGGTGIAEVKENGASISLKLISLAIICSC